MHCVEPLLPAGKVTLRGAPLLKSIPSVEVGRGGWEKEEEEVEEGERQEEDQEGEKGKEKKKERKRWWTAVLLQSTSSVNWHLL